MKLEVFSLQVWTWPLEVELLEGQTSTSVLEQRMWHLRDDLEVASPKQKAISMWGP